MAVIKTVICALLSLSTLTIANPIPTDVESRDLFQIEPVNIKRSLFNVDNIKADKDKKYLQEALKEAVDIAGIALKFMDDPKYSSFLSKWFGSDETAADDVRGVLTNFVGDNHNGEGSSVLGEVKVWQEDYWKRPPETPFCDRKGAGGRSPTAYYTKTTKTHAGHSMHYCPKFFERKSKADYLADSCKAIASHIDTDTTTRMYRGANVLHEFMHYEKVGKAQYVHLSLGLSTFEGNLLTI
jgi:hypothetical protein